MARSRMFGDDEPGDAKNASPRTTIVGGRPPESKAELPPVPTGIQKLLRLASVDESFRRELLERRAGISAAAGVTLTASEAAILAAIPAAQLEQMIGYLPPPPASRRAFLRQTASTAVVLLGGAVLAECVSCTKGHGADTPAEGEAGAAQESPPTAVDAGPSAPPTPDLDAGLPRPYEPAPPVAGIRPDPYAPTDEEPEPPRPESDPMTSEGGIAPHLPPEQDASVQVPDARDAAVRDVAERDVARPEEYHPTRGIRPDYPEPEPLTRPEQPISAPGGVRPDLPPVRPEVNPTAATGGAAPDEPEPPPWQKK